MAENAKKKPTVLIVGSDVQWVKILSPVFSTSFLVLTAYTWEPCLITRADVIIVVGNERFKKEVEEYPAELPPTYFGVSGSVPQPNRDGVTVFNLEEITLSYFVACIVAVANRRRRDEKKNIISL